MTQPHLQIIPVWKLITVGECCLFSVGGGPLEVGRIQSLDTKTAEITPFIPKSRQKFVQDTDVPQLVIGEGNEAAMLSGVEELFIAIDPVCVQVKRRAIIDIAHVIHITHLLDYDIAGMHNGYFVRFEVDWRSEVPKLQSTLPFTPYRQDMYSCRIFLGIDDIRECIRRMTGRARQADQTCFSETQTKMGEVFPYLYSRLFLSTQDWGVASATRVQRQPDLSAKRRRVLGTEIRICVDTVEALAQFRSICGQNLGINARWKPREIPKLKSDQPVRFPMDGDRFNAVVPVYDNDEDRTQAQLRPSFRSMKKDDCIELIYFERESKLSNRVSFTVVKGDHDVIAPILRLRPQTHGKKIVVGTPFRNGEGKLVKVLMVEDGWVTTIPLGKPRRSGVHTQRITTVEAQAYIDAWHVKST